MKTPSSVIKWALQMSSGTFLSRILGLLRDILLAAFFSRTITDAFVVAFRLPNLIRSLIGEGAMKASFIPIYVEKMSKDKQESFRSGVFTALLVCVSSIVALTIFFMEDVLSLILQGGSFYEVPGKFETTLFLSQVIFSYLFFVTLYAYFISILNAHKSFFYPALAPAFFNLTLIFFILSSHFHLLEVKEALCWGVVLGGVFQLLLVSLDLKRKKAFPRISWSWRYDGVGRFLKNFFPAVSTLGAFQLMGLLNIYFASHLFEGAHSYIYWADRILDLPLSLLAVSLSSALLPYLSELFVEGKKKEALELGQKELRFLLFLALPCGLGLWILSEPVIKMVYLRGAFQLEDAKITSEVLQIYSLILVVSCVYRILIPHFYACQKMWFPVLISFSGLFLHAILGIFFMDLWQLQGLIFSQALAAIFNLVMAFFFYIHLFGKKGWLKTGKSVLSFLPSLGIMGVFTSSFYFSLEKYLDSSLADSLLLLLTVFVSGAIYVGVSLWMGVSEGKRFMHLLGLRKQAS